MKLFSNDDSGAITVDWVILTAAIVGLSIATLAAVSGNVDKMNQELQEDIQKMETN